MHGKIKKALEIFFMEYIMYYHGILPAKCGDMDCIPLMGFPEKEDIQSITIHCNGIEERKITEEQDIALLVNAVNLLNYQLWGKAEGNPIIGITYHLENGNDINIEANDTTIWWHGKSHALKQPDVFVNIIEGLFFN